MSCTLSHTPEFIRWKEQEREGITGKSVLSCYSDGTTTVISRPLYMSILCLLHRQGGQLHTWNIEAGIEMSLL